MIHPLVYSALIIGIDQLSKHLTRTHVALNESIPVLGNFFRLTYIENAGIAFGINFPGGPTLFAAAAMVATVVVVWYMWRMRRKEFVLRFSLALILGGAIGNLIDRLVFGKVVDFFDFSIAGYHWPVFNVADSSVTIGVLLFLYFAVFRDSAPKREISS